MPWLETAPMEQRERFIRDDRLALYTMTELCDRYDISRKTGYKWLERFDAGGRAGLVPVQSAGPAGHPDPAQARRAGHRRDVGDVQHRRGVVQHV